MFGLFFFFFWGGYPSFKIEGSLPQINTRVITSLDFPSFFSSPLFPEHWGKYINPPFFSPPTALCCRQHARLKRPPPFLRALFPVWTDSVLACLVPFALIFALSKTGAFSFSLSSDCPRNGNFVPFFPFFMRKVNLDLECMIVFSDNKTGGNFPPFFFPPLQPRTRPAIGNRRPFSSLFHPPPWRSGFKRNRRIFLFPFFLLFKVRGSDG